MEPRNERPKREKHKAKQALKGKAPTAPGSAPPMRLDTDPVQPEQGSVPVSVPPPSADLTLADFTETDAERVKKYELLHQLARDVMSREMDRSKRKDDTAARYFSVFSLLIGVTVSVGTQIAGHRWAPTDFLQWTSAVMAGLFLLLMVGALSFTLAALRQPALKELSLTDETMAAVQETPYYLFIHRVTLGYREAVARNRPIIDRRADYLDRAHTCVAAALVSLGLSFMAAVAHVWIH